MNPTSFFPECEQVEVNTGPLSRRAAKPQLHTLSSNRTVAEVVQLLLHDLRSCQLRTAVRFDALLDEQIVKLADRGGPRIEVSKHVAVHPGIAGLD